MSSITSNWFRPYGLLLRSKLTSSGVVRALLFYSGSLENRTLICNHFWLKSRFFGQPLFNENPKVLIFWSPDFKWTSVLTCSNYSLTVNLKLIWSVFFSYSLSECLFCFLKSLLIELDRFILKACDVLRGPFNQSLNYSKCKFHSDLIN